MSNDTKMLRILFALSLFTLTSQALAGEECTCNNKGTKIPEGQTACIKTNSGMQMAQCSKVLNNTSWKFLGTPCPTAAVQTRHDENQSVVDMNKILKNLNIPS